MPIQPAHGGGGKTGKQRGFQQPLAVQHSIIALGTQNGFQAAYFAADGSLKQMFAPFAPLHRFHTAHKRMQPRNIGKRRFA